MSIEVMTWAWKTQLKPTLKLTLLALADYSNDEGICWPSIDSITKKSSLTRSSLIKNVQKLCDMGAIEKQKRYENGKRSSNEYRLKIDLSPESIRMEFGRPESIRMESIRMEKKTLSPESRPMTIYKPSVTDNRTVSNICAIDVNEKNNAQMRNAYFVKFYTAYPRHKDRKRAKKAFDKINPDEQLFNKIMKGVENLNNEIKLKDIPLEFCKYPAAWLNGECWEDEVDLSQPKKTYRYGKCKRCGKEKTSTMDYCDDCENIINPPRSKQQRTNAQEQLKNILPKVVHA